MKDKGDMEWIRTRIEALGTTQKAVGAAVGLNEKKMSQVISGGRMLKSVEILPLSRVLMMPPMTVLRNITGERGNDLMGEPSREDQQELFELISQLDEETAKATIQFLKTMFASLEAAD